MATATTNKMSSLINKGKLPALQVARLIHHHYVRGFTGRDPAGFTETELKKLASNIEPREWLGVSHWVEDGIDLLYCFAMNIKSDAALAAVEIHQLNVYLTMVIHFEDGDRLNKNFDKWDAKSLSIKADIHRALWYREALRIIGDYLHADWTLVASTGVKSMLAAIEFVNETMEDTSFVLFDIERLSPSIEVIEDWEQKVGKLNVRDFLLAVAKGEIEGLENSLHTSNNAA
jgi:hypothetical protein